MVFMAMGHNDTAQFVGILQHVRVVRQDKVHARMVVVGEHQAGVVEHHVAAAFECGHVLADGVEAAERDDAELGLGVTLLVACGRTAGSFAGSAAALLFRRVLRASLGIVEFGKLGALSIKVNVLHRFGGTSCPDIFRLLRFFSHVLPC